MPGGIRTPDPRLRRPLLYPTELLAQAAKLCQAFPIKKQEEYTNNNQSLLLIGVTGFEPATSRSLTERSTKLSHTPFICTATLSIWQELPADISYRLYQKGFEPPTHGLEGRCSIQLSYWYIWLIAKSA